jgi:hypothetical protein
LLMKLVVEMIFFGELVSESFDFFNKLFNDILVLLNFLILRFIFLLTMQNVIIHIIDLILQIFNILILMFVHLSQLLHDPFFLIKKISHILSLSQVLRIVLVKLGFEISDDFVHLLDLLMKFLDLVVLLDVFHAQLVFELL